MAGCGLHRRNDSAFDNRLAMMKSLPPSAVLAGIVCDNSDGDVLHDLKRKPKKTKRK